MTGVASVAEENTSSGTGSGAGAESIHADRPILAVGPIPPPYHGVATAMEQVVDLKDSYGMPVVVLDTADRRSLDNIGKLEFWNVWLALRHGLEFLWLLLTRRPGLVSLYISQGMLPFFRDFLFLAPTRLTGRRLVVHVQGGFFRQFYDESPRWLQWMIRWSMERADRVIVLGERFRYFFDGLVPPERVVVLPNAVDPTPFERLRERREAQGVKKPSEGDGGRLRVLYLATVKSEKGAVDLLEAAAAIRREVPDVEIVFHGEPVQKDAPAIERIMAEDELEGAVRFAGVVSGDAKIEAFLDADVFVFPSRYKYEGHPFVIVEAMAAGLPIVTTDHATIADTVLEGENGLIVPKGDPERIAEATVRLLKDPELRARMSKANLERLREHYTLKDWQRTLGEMFSEVLAEG